MRMNIDDGDIFMAEFTNGAIGSVQSSYVTIGNYPGIEARVYGEEGAIICRLVEEFGVAETIKVATPDDVEFRQLEIPQQFYPAGGHARESWRSLFYANLIRDFIDEDTILIGDGGDIVAQAAKVVPVMKENCWMDPGPLGTLGVGMPFALAAKLSFPDKKVLIIYGDGSFGLNGFEYDTAIRHNLPIVGIVGNDAAWGQMMRPQVMMYGRERMVATELAPTRYDKVVEALGGYGELVTEPDQIRPALERAYASGKAACINVMIRKDFDFMGGIYM